MKKIKNSLLAVAFLFIPALSLRGVTIQEEVAAELNTYIGENDEGIRESVQEAFHGQQGWRVRELNFHPYLPDGCEIIDMWGNNVLPSVSSGGQQWIIYVFVRYRGFRFSLGYVVSQDDRELHFSTLVMPL